MQDLVFHSKPKVYGFIYLLLIPLFGLVFYFLPETIGKEIIGVRVKLNLQVLENYSKLEITLL